LKQVLLSQKARNTASSTIAAVGTKKKCRKGSGGGGGGGVGGVCKGKRKISAIKTKHCTKEEWYKLSEHTRKQIMKIRAERKKHQISSLSSNESDAITAANTVKNASMISKVNVLNPTSNCGYEKCFCEGCNSRRINGFGQD
jgi:hypothetical protein